jgi:hypothetical protein
MMANIVLHERGDKGLIMEIVFLDAEDPEDYKPFNEISDEISASVKRSNPAAFLLNVLDFKCALDSPMMFFMTGFSYDRVNFRPRPCSIIAKRTTAASLKTFLRGCRGPGFEFLPKLFKDHDDALRYLESALDGDFEKRQTEGAPPRYFPEYVFPGKQPSVSLYLHWYSAYLKAMEEPPFHELAKKRSFHGYRFLFLPSFHAPVCIRLEIQPDNSGLLTIKKLSGAGGYTPGRLVVDESRRMSAGSVIEFLRILKKAAYWSMAAHEETSGLDGSQWIIEGAQMANYHFVDRWSPREGDFREAALYLWTQSGFSSDETY